MVLQANAGAGGRHAQSLSISYRSLLYKLQESDVYAIRATDGKSDPGNNGCD